VTKGCECEISEQEAKGLLPGKWTEAQANEIGHRCSGKEEGGNP
jgi:hypothetical protein